MCNFNTIFKVFYQYVPFMNVFTITNKSISFFLNLFKFDLDHETGLDKFVEVEFRPQDRTWAKEQLKKKFSQAA